MGGNDPDFIAWLFGRAIPHVLIRPLIPAILLGAIFCIWWLL